MIGHGGGGGGGIALRYSLKDTLMSERGDFFGIGCTQRGGALAG
jgi:hypothetical protein